MTVSPEKIEELSRAATAAGKAQIKHIVCKKLHEYWLHNRNGEAEALEDARKAYHKSKAQEDVSLAELNAAQAALGGKAHEIAKLIYQDHEAAEQLLADL